MARTHDNINKTHKDAPLGERDQLIRDIREVRRQLEAAYAFFALETDEDLLDAAIYQREALQARYRYLLRLAKVNNTVAAGVPVEGENRERWIN